MVSSASIGDSEREEKRWSDLVGVRRWWEGTKCWLTGVIYSAAAILSILIARGSDWFVTREQAGGGERRLVVILMMVLSVALVLVPYVQNLVIIVFLFAWTLTMITTAIPLNIALTSDFIVDEATGGLAFGLVILGGNAFRLAAPIVTGFLVASTSSFTIPFLFAVFLVLSGALLSWLRVKRPFRLRLPVKKKLVPRVGDGAWYGKARR